MCPSAIFSVIFQSGFRAGFRALVQHVNLRATFQGSLAQGNVLWKNFTMGMSVHKRHNVNQSIEQNYLAKGLPWSVYGPLCLPLGLCNAPSSVQCDLSDRKLIAESGPSFSASPLDSRIGRKILLVIEW